MKAAHLSRGSFVAGSLRWALVLLAASALLIGGVEIAVLAPGGAGARLVRPAQLFPEAGLVFVAAGVVAWWRRPSNRLGAIMVVGGLSLFAGGLEGFDVPVLAAVGVVLQSMSAAIAVHLILAFPSGRLRSKAAKLTTAAAYFTVTVLQVPLYLFNPEASSGGMLSVGNHPGLTMAGEWLQQGVAILIFTAFGIIVYDRLRRAAPRQRRVLAPLYLYGMVSVPLFPLLASVIQPLLNITPAMTGGLQLAVLMGIPVAFASVLLVGGFARTGEIQELGAWLSTMGPTRPSVELALARALGDDSVELGYWVAERQAYVDADGRPLELPDPRSGRSHLEISLDARLIGVVTYDALLIADPALVHAAGRVVAVAMDHERLTAELIASRGQLMASRARLLEASDRERRRIAQNLHDGLQMKLVLLAMEAQRLAGQPGATEVVAVAATTLRSRIDQAAGELRELVHDVMPAPLIEGGLRSAAQDLVDRLPLPTRLSLGVNGSLPRAVSSAAYFVVAEALANAVKHANASQLAVHLAAADGLLRVEVSDDGVGGVTPGGGLGLRSLADRVDVLGGRLSIHSPLGLGTRLVVELPCGE